MNPMFSRKMVLDLESVVQDKAALVCNRMQSALDRGEPADMHHLFRSVSIDVISSFSFNRCFDLLKSDDCGAKFFELTGGVGPSMWVFQQFPSIREMALRMPKWLASSFSEPLAKVLDLQEECVKQVQEVREQIDEGKKQERPTIFSTLLSPENKPDGYQIPPNHHLKDEAYSVIMAAADTTGNSMTVSFFHALRNPEIYRKLSEELKNAFPDPTDLPFAELEKLPYLV